jgi:signal transduction histidine kinase
VASAHQQLEISSRLSSLGTLAAGLTHEIRNPLAVIQSKLELLPKKIDDREYLMDLQEILPRNIDRIVELINRMLSFARPEKKKIEKVKISKLVNEVIDLIDGEASRHNVKIEKQFNEALVLEGDYNRLSQVFLNLMLNAIQSMTNGGTLKIVTQDNHGWVEVSVIDTGVGITPENLDKVFDPFYTSRPTGVGLGLSISRTIVEEHGGKIIVASAEGQGTTFKVSLPPSFPKVL